jgi:hypothetical protein
MDPITVFPASGMKSPRNQVIRLIAALAFGVAMGAILTFTILTQLRPASAAPAVGVAVSDGWAHSPITRLGGAYTPAGGGVAATDGWSHSPITRAGGSDSRAALLRHLAITYQEQNLSADARAR